VVRNLLDYEANGAALPSKNQEPDETTEESLEESKNI
jgi:hypothetical protein